MKKIILVAAILFALTSNGYGQYLQTINPPYENGYHQENIISEWGDTISKNSSYIEKDVGNIIQIISTETYDLGAIKYSNDDKISTTFSVPISGYYEISPQGTINGSHWNLSFILLGICEGDIQSKLYMHVNAENNNVVETQEIYNTGFKASNSAIDSLQVLTGFLGKSTPALTAVNKFIDLGQTVSSLQPENWSMPIETTTIQYLEQNVVYTFSLGVYSQLGSITAGVSFPTDAYPNQLTALQMIVDLQSVKIELIEGVYYTISTTIRQGGSIEPEGVIYVGQGGSKTFNATPETGYEVYQWIKDGVADQTGGNTYTLSNIQSNTDIEVTFKLQANPEDATETITASADSTVVESSPTLNMGNSSTINVQTDTSDYYGLVQFDLDSIPSGSSINDVELRFYCTYDNGSQIYMAEIDSSWSESSVTWNSKPNQGYEYTFFHGVNGTGYLSIKDNSLTNLVQDWLDGVESNHGIYIYGGNVGDSFVFSSSEDSSSYRPKLIIGYTPPDPPDLTITDLYPEPTPTLDQYTVGQEVVWHVTVKNNGSGPADSSTVKYYLGTSPTDFSNSINSDSTSALDSGKSETDDDSYTFTASDVGERYLICKADDDNDIEEVSENNNTRVYGPFTVILPKISTPVISPNGGTYTGSVQVELSATSGAIIRYTTNGATPTSSSTIYTGTLTISSSCTVKAKAFMSGYTVSDTASALFTTTAEEIPELSVLPNTHHVEADSGSTTFTIVNTGTGTLSYTAMVISGENWISISSGSNGTDFGTINVDFTENPSGVSRTGIIRVIAPEATNSPVDVTVTQSSAAILNLSVSPGSQSINFNQGITSFTVNNAGAGTMDWTATVISGSSWLSITSGSSGTNSGTITVAFLENSTGSSRTGTIRITASGASGNPKDVTVIQSGTSGVDDRNVTLGVNGGTATAGSTGTYLSVSHPPSNAIDEDETTDWCNSWLMPDWMTVEFNQTYEIHEVGVVWGTGAHNQTFSISLSEDGANWQVVVPSRLSATDAGDDGGYHGNTTIVRERFPISPTYARFIRIDVTDTSAPSGHIFKAIVHELQAFTVSESSIDTDSDGISDEVENSGPNHGDGNNDGIADSLQDNVTSIQSYGGGEYITLESPVGTRLSHCQAVSNPATDTAPDDIEFPYGLIDFTINGIAQGGSTRLMLYFPANATLETYYKYGRTPGDPTDHWYEFLYDGGTGAEIDTANNIITLHFIDAERGDDILSADSLVVDLGGPGITSNNNTPTGGSSSGGGGGGGGCFISTLRPGS